MNDENIIEKCNCNVIHSDVVERVKKSLPKEEVPKEQIKKELPKENIVSFNSVLESDAIPIIESNNLTPEKVGEDIAIKEKKEEKDIFLQEDLFPEIKIKE